MPAQLSLLPAENDEACTTQVRPRPHLTARPSLDELDEALERYAENAHAPNTRRAYSADWKRFTDWCAEAGLKSLPAEPRTLGRYLASMAQQGRKPSTIRRARIAIGRAHVHAGLPRPDAHPSVHLVERGIRRTSGLREEGAPALLPEELAAVVRALGRGRRAERDRAMLLLGFAGAFRRSELVVVRVEHLRFADGGLEVKVPRSKEDQEGRGATVFVPPARRPELCPVDAMRRWLLSLAEDDGPVFVRFKDGMPTRVALNDVTVGRVLQRAAKRAGLEGSFSAHSLRSGFATAAHLAGEDDRAIQRHGRWSSAAGLRRYVQQGRKLESLL